MSEKIFREKSLERVSSPEELNQYIKATTPGLWFIMGAIIMMLIGIIVWSTIGKIDSGSDVGCTFKNGQYECYVKVDNFDPRVDTPMVKVDDIYSEVANSIEGPFEADYSNTDYVYYLSGIETGDWFYVVKGKILGVEDGEDMCFFVREQISPITFVFN